MSDDKAKKETKVEVKSETVDLDLDLRPRGGVKVLGEEKRTVKIRALVDLPFPDNKVLPKGGVTMVSERVAKHLTRQKLGPYKGTGEFFSDQVARHVIQKAEVVAA